MAVDFHKLDNALSQQPGYRSVTLSEYGFDFVRRVPNKLAAVLRTQRDAMREVDADARLSAYGKQELNQQIKGWAETQINSLNTKFDTEAGELQKDTAPPIKAMNAEQKAAFEAKAPRLWERVRNQLDAGVDVVTVVKNADRDTLQVIEEEIDAYNLAKWPANEQLAKLETQAARHLIDQHRPTVSTPEEAKLFGQRKDIESGINNVTGAFNWARHALGEPSVRLIPAFERGQAVNIHGE